MKIRTKILLFVVGVVGLLFALGAIEFYTNWQEREASAQNILMDQLIRERFDLYVHTEDFLKNADINKKAQWEDLHNSLTQILMSPELKEYRNKKAFLDLKENLVSTKILFDQLMLAQAQENTALRDQIALQLYNQDHATLEESFGLSKLVGENLQATQAGAREIIAIVLVLLVVISLFDLWYVTYEISKPIEELTNATSQITARGFEYNVSENLLDKKDEIGKLARTFGGMVGALKKSYTNLEQQVQGRTKELQEKINELNAMNKAMIGRELKMVELKKEIEELQAKING